MKRFAVGLIILACWGIMAKAACAKPADPLQIDALRIEVHTLCGNVNAYCDQNKASFNAGICEESKAELRVASTSYERYMMTGELKGASY